MAFSQTTITDVLAQPQDAELRISWRTSSPAGTVFQVYVEGQLVYHGTQTWCVIPMPPAGATQINVGTVDAADELTDYASSLPATVADQAQVAWCGGTYLDPDLVGFYVYQSPSAGAAINTVTPIATVPAYAQGSITDGYGLGGYGYGGFGQAASSYTWISLHLAAGVWQFGVAAYDSAGNVGPISTVSLTIVAPPLPPGRNAAGQRLTYTYNPSTRIATLNWLPPAA